MSSRSATNSNRQASLTQAFIIQNARVAGKDSASARILLNALLCVKTAFRLIGEEMVDLKI
jgi:hypothetical protein